MLKCTECSLDNPPSAVICEACSALIGGVCNVCGDDGDADKFLISGRRLWDGFSDSCLDGAAVVAVVNGKVAYAGLMEYIPAHLASLPTLLDFSGIDCTMMPGLIDSHVHLEFSQHHSLHEQPRQSAVELMAKMESRAKSMVQHGITTCRDLGGNPNGALALRSRIRQGECLGPRLLCAGSPITRPRGHCWQWGGEASTESQIKEVVQKNLSSTVNADVIKIMATGGIRTAGTNPAESAFSESEIRVAVEAAHAAGRKVAAHAHGVGGIVNAARAGVDTIEHCSWVDRHGRWGSDAASIITEMARRRIHVCPTIGAGWLHIPSLQDALGPALERMRAQGVPIIAGSDAGAIPNLAFHRLADGIVVMARCGGFGHAEALRSATSTAACALGLQSVCGALVEGLSADLIVVRGNPIEELEAICAPPLAIVCRGKPVAPCPGGRDRTARPSWSLPLGWAAPGGKVAVESALGSSSRCQCMQAGK